MRYFLMTVLMPPCILVPAGDTNAKVDLFQKEGLALVSTRHPTILKMSVSSVPMSISFKITGETIPQSQSCFDDSDNHLNVLLAMTIKEKLMAELEPYDLVLKVKTILPNVTESEAIRNVNAIKMDTSSWSKAYERAVLKARTEALGDEAWKPRELSTTWMPLTTSMAMEPTTTTSMQPTTTTTLKTTATSTQVSWEGPFYPETGDGFLDSYEGVSEDFEELYEESAVEEDCCPSCACITVATEDDFKAKVYKLTNQIQVQMNGLSPNANFEMVKNGDTTVIVIDAENGSMVVQMESLEILAARLDANILVLKFDTMFLRFLRGSVMVFNCVSCHSEVKLKIMNVNSRWSRSVAAWLFDLESKEDFDRQMGNLKRQQEDWVKRVKMQHDTDVVNIENIRVHEEAVTANIQSLHAEICRMKSDEMISIRELVMNNHARRVVTELMTIVSACQYGHQVPKGIMNKEKWQHLCIVSYQECDEDFLAGFVGEIRCKVNGVAITTESLLLEMELEVPVGPGVKYSSHDVKKVPVFHNGTIQVLKTEASSVLFRTTSKHNTVVSSCEQQSKFTVCDIADASEFTTSCISHAIQKQPLMPSCFNEVPRRDSMEQCRVVQTNAGLLISTEMELQASSTALSLNGFSSAQSTKNIPAGVTFVEHKNDDVIKIRCHGMEFQTSRVGKKIEVIRSDLKIQEPILNLQTKNQTRWKDLTMEKVFKRVSDSMDRMYKDETVQPLFSNARSVWIMIAATMIVVITVVIICACCCGRRILDGFKCVKQICCCLERRPNNLHFQGQRMSSLERQSHQL